MMRRIGAVAFKAQRGVLSSAASMSAIRRPMSSLDKKERGEEARYMAKMDAENIAKMKAKFESVLASGDAAAKEELMDVLDVKPEEEKGIISQLGLDDWRFALPIGLFIGIPTMANEVLVLNAESQLVACFILFCATMHSQVGGMVAKSLDEYR